MPGTASFLWSMIRKDVEEDQNSIRTTRENSTMGKEFPKNLRKIGALIHEEFGITVSKDTYKRILKMLRSVASGTQKVKDNPIHKSINRRKRS